MDSQNFSNALDRWQNMLIEAIDIFCKSVLILIEHTRHALLHLATGINSWTYEYFKFSQARVPIHMSCWY